MHSLLDQYPLESYEPFYHPSYGLNSSTTFFTRMVLALNNPQRLTYHQTKTEIFSVWEHQPIETLSNYSCNKLICKCMQKHIQHNKDERTQFFRKIYLSLYLKGFERYYYVRGELETEQRLQHIDPYSSGHRSISFLFSWAAQLVAGGPQSLLGHGSHSSIFSPTDLNFLSPGLYNNLTPTYFLWASHLYPIQPVDSQGYPLISSIGCTCYLHRCISHLTARPGWRSICYTQVIRRK